jgi:phosphate transport system substrate-binding protein
MKKTFILSILIYSILFASCSSRKNRENTINISGAFALYPLVVKWAEEYKKEHPEVRFNISGGGAGKGMADALAGTVELGMFSREISDEEIKQGAWWVGLTIDAVVPTISDQNPNLDLLKRSGLSQKEFKSIFIDGTINDWKMVIKKGGKGKLEVYNRSDACGAAETWAKYLGGKQENLKGTGIFGDPGLAEAVANDPSGIGFNNTIYAYDLKTGKKRAGMEIVPIDINDNDTIDQNEDFYSTFDGVLKAISDGIYPSPPARELYFVSKGKPTKKVVLDFINWTLTKGQKFIKEAGYVMIDQKKINEYMDKLK